MKKQAIKKKKLKHVSLLLIFSLLLLDIAPIFPSIRVQAEESNNRTDESIVQEEANEIPIEKKDTLETSTTHQQESNITNPGVEDSTPELEENSIEQVTKDEPASDQEATTGSVNEENSKEADEKAEVDYNLLPQLLITEIMPNNDGADDYEYFEVYNNSNQPIIVDHYTIALRYTDGSGNPDVPFVFDPVTVQPSQTLVFWRNNANKSLDDFNNYYQASLTAQDVVEYDGAEFYNSGNRGVVVKNKENEMVSVNYLPEDISSGRVVEYTHPTSGTEMKTYQTVTDPSPGSIKEEQLPAQVVDVPENAEPVIDHQHLHKIEAGKDVTIEAKITDDHNDLDAKVFYKTIDEDTYNQLVMTKQEGDAYQAVISANDIVADQMSYYVTVTDPNHRVTYPAPDKSIEVMNQPEIEEDTKAPEITHTPVAEVEALSSITIDATIVDNLAVPTATLFVKGEEDETFTALAMSPTASDTHSYSVEIPGFYVKSTMTYYIEATDGTNVSKTEEYTIKVRQEESNDDQVPELLVTEVVPDSANVGSADGYEFIEIYNNTNKPINFNDYKIQYRYGSDPESDVIWPSVPDDVVIPSKETLIFWIINGQNDNQTVEDFNANYGTSLVDNKDIVRIYSAGMANGSMRGLIVASNVGRELSIAYYNDVETQDDTHADKGILYKYPVDGSNMMEKVSAGLTAATPGSVESFQVPSETVTVPNDNVAPAIENMTEQTEVNQTDNIQLKADAKDDLEVKTVQVYYRTDDETDYQMALLEAGYDDMLFHHIIYSPEIIAKEYVEYYFVASDGINKTTSDVHKIKITNSLDVSSLRLNVDEGQIISGEQVIKGTSKDDAPEDVRLSIDGAELSTDLYQSIEHSPYLAFEVSGINTYFQNGVTIGDSVIHIFDDWIAQWETITVKIEPEQLDIGDNTITIRAGNKATSWEGDPGENRDDYNLRNVRLVLSNGTEIRDVNHADPTTVYDMGDEGTYRVAEDFIFTISDQQATSIAYKWDTTAVADGEHTINVRDLDESIEANVFIDNTAPAVSTNVEEGKEYKGVFEINATFTDAIAGIESSRVLLDGKEIDIPYATSSGKLTSGSHELKLEATDKVGNQATKVVTFSVVNENPDKPVSDTDASQPINGDPILKVNVLDPTNDAVDVTFYQGYQYTPNDVDRVKSFSNASDIEPPDTQVPSGETMFTEDDISLTSTLDKEYMITDSSTQFPYHRFDVTVDSEVDEEDIVELVWNGNSLPGRKVTMYAWNHTANKWEIIDYHVAETDDFELKGTVTVTDFVKDYQVNVLVQDEIPNSSTDYDYTFVWMTDTQYYSESYPYIFDQQTKWIAEQQEEMNIQYVFHTGDLVDESDKEYQWINADNYMKTLDDANIRYGVLAGNHDVSQKTNDYTEYYKYFGADRFKNKSYYGGSYQNNRGHYDLISVDGNDYIMVYLGWGVEDEGIAWMNEVLAQHPDRIAILSFHEYLQATGTRHPLGEKLYNEVVLPNKNVVAVLSGHYHESQMLVDDIDDDGDGTIDRSVYQMLADYQAGPEGGQGYMRLLHFDTDNNRIMVNTYSPYMDDYNYYNPDAYPGKDEFAIDLDLTPTEKRVATDYFSVNVYTNNEIGAVKNVASGESAEVIWTGLEEGNTYSWYTIVSDEFTGEVRSDIWTFVKGESEIIESPVPVPGDGADEDGQPGVPGNPGRDEESPEAPVDPNEGGSKDGTSKDQPDSGDQIGSKDLNNGDDQEKENLPNSDENGEKLANTFSNMFNLLAIGFAMILLGVGLLMYRKLKTV